MFSGWCNGFGMFSGFSSSISGWCNGFSSSISGGDIGACMLGASSSGAGAIHFTGFAGRMSGRRSFSSSGFSSIGGYWGIGAGVSGSSSSVAGEFHEAGFAIGGHVLGCVG